MHDAHLRMLEELHDHHALTDEEYDAARGRILRAVAKWRAAGGPSAN